MSFKPLFSNASILHVIILKLFFFKTFLNLSCLELGYSKLILFSNLDLPVSFSASAKFFLNSDLNFALDLSVFALIPDLYRGIAKISFPFFSRLFFISKITLSGFVNCKTKLANTALTFKFKLDNFSALNKIKLMLLFENLFLQNLII